MDEEDRARTADGLGSRERMTSACPPARRRSGRQLLEVTVRSGAAVDCARLTQVFQRVDLEACCSVRACLNGPAHLPTASGERADTRGPARGGAIAASHSRDPPEWGVGRPRKTTAPFARTGDSRRSAHSRSWCRFCERPSHDRPINLSLLHRSSFHPLQSHHGGGNGTLHRDSRLQRRRK